MTLLFIFKEGSYTVSQVGLELGTILLPQPLKCLDYRSQPAPTATVTKMISTREVFLT